MTFTQGLTYKPIATLRGKPVSGRVVVDVALNAGEPLVDPNESEIKKELTRIGERYGVGARTVYPIRPIRASAVAPVDDAAIARLRKKFKP